MALNENRLDVAERILKPYLKEDPFDAAAIRMLAELAARIGRWTGRREPACAEPSSLRPAGRPPKPISHWSSAAWVARPRRWSCSTTSSRKSRRTSAHWNLKAATLGRLGDFDEAIELYEGVLAACAASGRASG